MSERNVILEVRNLKQYFINGRGKRRIITKAVDDVSFDIYDNETFGLVGESGSGKTTTGRTIVKLYQSTDGTVKYKGRVISAGIEGLKREIRVAKREYNLVETKSSPRKYHEYLVKQELKKKTDIIQEEIRDTEYETFMAEKSLKSSLSFEQNVIANLNRQLITLRSKKKKEHKLAHKRITVPPKMRLNSDYRLYKKTARVRFRDKSIYLKDALLSKEEKKAERKKFVMQYFYEMFSINDEMAKRLKKELPAIYVKFRVKDYEKRIKSLSILIKDAIDEGEIENLTDLKHKFTERLSKIDLTMENIDVDRKKEILIFLSDLEVQLDQKYDEQIAAIEAEIALISKNHSQIEKINQQIVEINSACFEKVRTLMAQASELKKHSKDAIKDFNEGTGEVLASNEDVLQAKKKFAQIRLEMRKEIANLNRINQVKETFEEEKARKLLEMAIKEKYRLQAKEVKGFSEKFELKKSQWQEVKELRAKKPSYKEISGDMQMIFQDPISSLNPRMTVREIISESLIIQGHKDKVEIDKRVFEVLKLVGLLPEHADRYPHEFSGGQRQRIGIARSIVVEPRFIIADEPISALDVSIQAQVMNLLKDLKEKLGLTILFIAHDLSVVKYFSDRIAVMNRGKIVEMAPTEVIFSNALHPYTKSLLSAIPKPDPDSEKSRLRFDYDVTVHDYRRDKPSFREVGPDHFVYANDKEFSEYKRNYKEVKK